MKRALLGLLVTVLISGCAQHLPVPSAFTYQEIPTSTFRIASWQKIQKPGEIVHVYIEGDGYAYNAHGRVSSDPTPKGSVLRELAFGDPHPNVIYMARPCQFVKGDTLCSKKYWSTSRFAPEVITAEYEAIHKSIPKTEMVLIGFSGGAQVAGLLATTTALPIKKVVTVSGNLDHEAWTKTKGYIPLTGSMSLRQYRDAFLQIPQKHFVGRRDTVIEPALVKVFVGPRISVVEVEGATHVKGWESMYPAIWASLQ